MSHRHGLFRDDEPDEEYRDPWDRDVPDEWLSEHDGLKSSEVDDDPRERICQVCGGTGIIRIPGVCKVTCEDCDGEGVVR